MLVAEITIYFKATKVVLHVLFCKRDLISFRIQFVEPMTRNTQGLDLNEVEAIASHAHR